MAKDDYYVVTYRILQYLYDVLKAGQLADIQKLTAKKIDIPERYWNYVFINLKQEGFVSGVEIEIDAGEEVPVFANLQITPKGISYLIDNNLLNKAQAFMKNVKDAVPFV